mgnify:FL=1
MSDDADKTQDRIELEETLRRREMKNIKYVEGTGFCLNCGEKLNDNRRWCDKDCADDWDYLTKRK